MRAYIIKHKGANNWYNMSLDRDIEFTDGTTIYAGYVFFRRKDALKYLKTLPYPEHKEVVGVTLDKSEKDNRKRSI